MREKKIYGRKRNGPRVMQYLHHYVPKICLTRNYTLYVFRLENNSSDGHCPLASIVMSLYTENVYAIEGLSIVCVAIGNLTIRL